MKNFLLLVIACWASVGHGLQLSPEDTGVKVVSLDGPEKLDEEPELLDSLISYNYDFLEEDCHKSGRVLDLSPANVSLYGFVRVVRQGGYSPNKNCAITVTAPPNHHLVVRVRRIEIYRPEKDCGPDYMQIQGVNTTRTYCGYGSLPYALISLSRSLTFRMVSGDFTDYNERIGFDLYYTAYHQGVCDSNYEFRCRRDYRCIPKEVICDELDNCGDWSDERASTCGLSTSAIIGITVSSVIIGGSCLAFLVYHLYSKKKDRIQRRARQNEIHETMTVEYTRRHRSHDDQGPNRDFVPGMEPPPPYTFAEMFGKEKCPDLGLPAYAPPNYTENVFDTIGNGGSEAAPNANLQCANRPPPGYDNAGFTPVELSATTTPAAVAESGNTGNVARYAVQPLAETLSPTPNAGSPGAIGFTIDQQDLISSPVTGQQKTDNSKSGGDKVDESRPGVHTGHQNTESQS